MELDQLDVMSGTGPYFGQMVFEAEMSDEDEAAYREYLDRLDACAVDGGNLGEF